MDKILIIEDDVEINKLLSDFLTENKYEVIYDTSSYYFSERNDTE